MTQHPQFESFKSAWRAQDYALALTHIDALIAAHPQVASLHWYRANCLEKLGQHPQALQAVDTVISLQPDHAPALVRQVALDWCRDADGEQHDGFDDEELPPAQQAELERRHAQRRQRHIAQLQHALLLDPTLADACFGLSQLLRQGEDGEWKWQDTQADAWLERAIALLPQRAEFRAARGELHEMRALLVSSDAPADASVTGFSGAKYLRTELEAALRDFTHCAALDGTHRYLVKAAEVLHNLGRFDEALAQYDLALQRLPPDAPQRDALLEVRARSENNGAGEREQIAWMLESTITPGDRNLADDNAAQLLLSTARAVRKGKRVDEAMAARFSESPDDLLAANLAEQILNVAYEDPPGLVAVDSTTFPAYQRKHAARQRKALAAAGFRFVADTEATGMTRRLGLRVLLSFHVDDSGGIGADTFAMKAKWPGLATFVLMLVTGKWKVHSMTECITHFDDQGFLITQYENISPFTYGNAVDIERLPRSASVAALVARHRQRVAAYQQAHPQARALPATDLAAIEANICRGQAIKRAYRQSVSYATEAELRGMLGGNYERLAEKIRAKLLELAPDRE
jgi:tetratricopeptide (TPR) repeat protein